jgi:hypothetical protein
VWWLRVIAVSELKDRGRPKVELARSYRGVR